MKKRIILIAAVLLCAVFLCGASCDHEWQSGSGEFTSVCAKCGVEVQGESEDALAMQRYLVGNWDCEFNYIYDDPLFNTDGSFDEFTCMHIYFDGKGNARFRNHVSDWQDCTYEYYARDYVESDPDDINEDSDYAYTLFFYDPDGNYYTWFFLAQSEGKEPYINSDLVMIPGVEAFCIYRLTKTDDVTAAMEGSWICAGEDGLCSLELNVDRSLSGDVFGAVQGQWQANATYTEGSTLCSKVMIAFEEKSGELVFHTAILSAPDANAGMSEQRENCTLTFSVDGKELVFRPQPIDEATA